MAFPCLCLFSRTVWWWRGHCLVMVRYAKVLRKFGAFFQNFYIPSISWPFPSTAEQIMKIQIASLFQFKQNRWSRWIFCWTKLFYYRFLFAPKIKSQINPFIIHKTTMRKIKCKICTLFVHFAHCFSVINHNLRTR